MKNITGEIKIILWLLLPLICSTVFAQTGIIPCRVESCTITSGVHSCPVNIRAKSAVVFCDTLVYRDAPWLRLYFDDFNLGEQSFVVITSLEDCANQRLDARTFPQWRNSSAFFNGDAVSIELHAVPGDSDVFFRLSEVAVGERGGFMDSKDLCGDDNRISSGDDAIGRLLRFFGGGGYNVCTGWITSNGAHLAAGHCIPKEVLQFNVPGSDSDGTINHPGPDDQYSIDTASVEFAIDDPGVGDDWAVFDCHNNSNTDLSPIQAQASFYRMTRDSLPGNVRVTGYGSDDTPNGTTGGRNLDNFTQQTSTGAFDNETVEGASDVYLEYFVDTEGGNSGSPVNIEGGSLTIGIHTNGGCNPFVEGNYGTSFENNNLEDAIHTFPGDTVEYTDYKYADHDHPIAFEDGTVFRPYNTVKEAVDSVATGGIVSIVKGTYPASDGNTFIVGDDGKAMILEAPVGTVIIGE